MVENVSTIASIGKEMLSESKFYMGYSRWNDEKGRYETWSEAVDRVMDMHKTKYADKLSPELLELMDYAADAYKDKLILGAQRALQFGGEQLLRHQAKAYNCSTSYADRAAFFNEAFYLLLCGCGVGFSVQPHHTNKLPGIAKRSEEKVLEFVVPDSIEGWADAVAVLLSSYFTDNAVFPEYKGHKVLFDFSLIRPRGAMISGGFKAPGPDGLRNALVKIEALIERELAKGSNRLRPIDVYDIVMHIADAVLSGGVRRSATICLFDKNDQEMMKAKTGDWFVTNPQRGRSNNSALLIRDDLTREEWADIMKSVKDFGEPGFVFAESTEWAYNPCVTGDALLICKDHGVTKNGEMIVEGVEYEIPLEKYVELYGDDNNYRPMVLSYDEKTGKKVWGHVTAAALTRKNAEVIELEIDEGTTLRVTPDHKVYTENRGWVEAKDLTTEDILIM